jgi:hypothetical protein
VGRAGVDEEGVPELPNVAQALEGRRVHDAGGRGLEGDVLPEQVSNDVPAGSLAHRTALRVVDRRPT